MSTETIEGQAAEIAALKEQLRIARLAGNQGWLSAEFLADTVYHCTVALEAVAIAVPRVKGSTTMVVREAEQNVESFRAAKAKFAQVAPAEFPKADEPKSQELKP
jgi:hypothetical protein